MSPEAGWPCITAGYSSLAQAGEREKALAWLERGVEKRAWDMGFLAVAPDYRNLRGEPRFTALLEKIGLPTSAPANPADVN